MPIDALYILKSHYPPQGKTYDLLLRHSELVARKALTIAHRLIDQKPDLEFISEASLLHDIGIGLTRTPSLGCKGYHPYLRHGVLGRRILEQAGFFRHALVCERHVGVGLYAQEIERLNLPLPAREMLPISIEEKIICYADKFFSKSINEKSEEKSISQILKGLRRYGLDKTIRFQSLHNDLQKKHL